MNAWVAVWIVANVASVGVLTYAVRDAWEDYRIASSRNGWRRAAAKSMLRSQAVRLVEVTLLLAAALIAATWPATPPMVESRPEWVMVLLRVALTSVVVLIAVNAVLDVTAKRRILRRQPTRR